LLNNPLLFYLALPKAKAKGKAKVKIKKRGEAGKINSFKASQYFHQIRADLNLKVTYFSFSEVKLDKLISVKEKY